MGLQGRVAWVTGGGRGIGRACAVALAREGCKVAVSSRTASELSETVAACRTLEVAAMDAPCDVTEPSQVANEYARIRKQLGTPAILVSAAGLARSEALLKTTPEFMRRMWDLNVMGTFHTIQAALPAMAQAGWGRVVTIASIAAKVGHPYVAAYTASKHGVLGLTRAVAAEFAAKGVTANAVCPGYVDTQMTRENVDVIVKKTGMSPDEALERIKRMSPQNRLVRPEEVASLVAHLCRDEAGGINGQAITIDGGGVQW